LTFSEISSGHGPGPEAAEATKIPHLGFRPQTLFIWLERAIILLTIIILYAVASK
jgi:hypothetical protein